MDGTVDSVLEKMKSRIILRAGENSVIDNARLPHLDRDRAVVLSQEVYETLKLIVGATNFHGFEVPFILYGWLDTDNAMFVFDDIDADASVGDNPHESNFSQKLAHNVSDFALGARREENKVVAHGHSHPRFGNYYLNFSLSDIRAYFNMRNKTWMQNVLFCGCLLTGGNFNFVFCDGKDVYRIDTVCVQNKKGQIVRIPSFGPDVANLSRGQSRGR